MAPKRRATAAAPAARKARLQLGAELLDAALSHSLAQVEIRVDAARARSRTRGLEVVFQWSDRRWTAFWLVVYVNYKALELCRLIDGRVRRTHAEVEDGLALLVSRSDALRSLQAKAIDDGLDANDDQAKDAFPSVGNATVTSILSDMSLANHLMAGRVAAPAGGPAAPVIVAPVGGQLTRALGALAEAEDDDGGDDDDDDYTPDVPVAGASGPPAGVGRVTRRGARAPAARCKMDASIDCVLEKAKPLFDLYQAARNEHAGRAKVGGPDESEDLGSEDGADALDAGAEVLDAEDQKRTRVDPSRRPPPRVIKSEGGDERNLALSLFVAKSSAEVERAVKRQSDRVQRLVAVPEGTDGKEHRARFDAENAKLEAMRNMQRKAVGWLTAIAGTRTNLRLAAGPALERWLLEAPAPGAGSGPNSAKDILVRAVVGALPAAANGNVLALTEGGGRPQEQQQPRKRKIIGRTTAYKNVTVVEEDTTRVLTQDDSFMDM